MVAWEHQWRRRRSCTEASSATFEDSSGAALPGATVTITSKETGLSKTVVTNDVGSYTFTNVLAGVYDVKVSLQGFKESVKADVPVTVNTVSRAGRATRHRRADRDRDGRNRETALLQTDKADTHTELKSASDHAAAARSRTATTSR